MVAGRCTAGGRDGPTGVTLGDTGVRCGKLAKPLGLTWVRAGLTWTAPEVLVVPPDRRSAKALLDVSVTVALAAIAANARIEERFNISVSPERLGVEPGSLVPTVRRTSYRRGSRVFDQDCIVA